MDSFFLLDLHAHRGNTVRVKSELEDDVFEVEAQAVRTVVKGLVDLAPYCIRNDRRVVLFPYGPRDGKVAPLPERTLSKGFPLAWAYIKRHHAALKERGATVWYAYRRRNYDLRDDIPRILVPSIATRTSFTFDPTGKVHFVGSGGGGGGGYGLNKRPSCPIDERYALGILNSRLTDWMVKQSNSRFGHGYYSFNRQFIEPLRIPATTAAMGRRHDELVALVDTMLSLHKRELAAKHPQEQARLRREIAATDRRIDQLVYELYGLTDAEIRVVEEATAPPAAAETGS